MRLIDEWRSAWRFLSIWLAAFAGTALQLYEQIPMFKAYIPETVFHHLMTALVVFIIVGRLIKQGEPNMQIPNVQPPAK